MIEYQYAFIKTNSQGISIFPTHNLEIPGSSLLTVALIPNPSIIWMLCRLR